MLAVFRTDASNSIGTGHVMRSLTLAEALTSKGFEILFVCRELEGHLCDEITGRGFTVYRLPAPDHPIRNTASLYSSWLGVTEPQDAGETLAALAHVSPDWLVVDHYGLGRDWEISIRPAAGRLLAIDDLARAHECDLLVDQNLVSGMRGRYDGLVTKRCNLMLGPEYALLQPIYAQLHDRVPPREGPVRRILVSFGGSDQPNMTERTLECILGLNRPDITVDVVVSSGHLHVQEIQECLRGNAQIHLHKSLSNLASIMVSADLAIGAVGVTSWERLCLGLPAIVVTIADNQRPVAAGLHEMGLIRWIGHHDEVDVQKMCQALNGILEKGFGRGLVPKLPENRRRQGCVSGRHCNECRPPDAFAIQICPRC